MAHRDKRHLRRLADAWEQSQAHKASVWGRIRWNERTDFGRLLERLTPQLTGVVYKAAHALVRLQARHFGAVIADGEKIARTAGIGESTWWEIARPELERVGFLRTVERGGGRMPGGDGRANVYMSPEAGEQPAPPRSPAAEVPAEASQAPAVGFKEALLAKGAPPELLGARAPT